VSALGVVHTPNEVDSDRLDPAFVKLAVILMTGVVWVVFDTTIVNVALDTIARRLNTSVSMTQWTVSAYVLAIGMVVPVSGWASKRFGSKQSWMAGIIVFAVGSILASVAWNVDSLVAFRVLQGAGGGIMLPLLMTLLVQAAGGRPLGKVMATVSLPVLIGPIFGPVLGGLIVSHLSWRYIFWVNVPFSLVGLVLAWRGLERTTPHRGVYLDVVGLVLLSPALAAIIYGLTEVGIRDGFGYTVVIAPLVGGVVLMALYAWHALASRRPPVLDLRLFRVRSFTASTSLMFLSGLSLYGILLLLPLYYQQVRGQSALTAGLLLAPQGVGILCTRNLAGKLSDRLGSRPIVLSGFVLTLAGSFVFTQLGVHTNEAVLVVSLVVRGAGLGAVTIPVMASVYLGVESDEVPQASSAIRIMQQVGGSFGTAVVGMILATQLIDHDAGGLAGRATAFDDAFWWSLGLTAVAIIPALALPGGTRRNLQRDRKRPDRPQPHRGGKRTAELDHDVHR
jgi:EmrB/QacA subfamily drug resistance transporter